MKLSQAIIKGSFFKYQIKGRFSDGFLGRCVMGCIHDTLPIKFPPNQTSPFRKEMVHFVVDKYPLLAKMEVTPPCGCTWVGTEPGSRHVWDLLVHLNNSHKWSFKKIAKFVESVEEAEHARLVKEVSSLITAVA